MRTGLRALLFALACLPVLVQAAEARRATLPVSCRSAGGQWSAAHRECAPVSQRWCSQRGGRFNACASACRHNPDKTAPCIMLCVPVCGFT
ncbi:MAG: hypothetical protein ACRCTD_05675 [Beijerinckiaceae bacterium]